VSRYNTMNRTQIHSPTPEDEANSSRLSEIVSVAPEVPCRPFKRIPEDRHSTVRRSHRTPSKCSSTTQCKVLRGNYLLRDGLNFTVTFTCKDLDVSKGSKINSCFVIKTEKFSLGNIKDYLAARKCCQYVYHITSMNVTLRSAFPTAFGLSHISLEVTWNTNYTFE